MAYGVKDNGFQVLLLLFYNQALGLDAALAGLAIMLALLADAFLDPVIGYMSDRLRSPLGRRHPFMYVAALPVASSYLLLFSPPRGLGQPALFAYLLVVAVLVRFFIALYEIPSSALVAELSDSYDERTAFISYRYFFGWVGGLLMSILAFSVFLTAGPGKAAAQLNTLGYSRYGWAASAIMFCAILISALGTQRAVRPVEAAVARTRPARNLWIEVYSTLGSRSALMSLLAVTFMLLATSLSYALGTFFNIYAFGFSAQQISILVTSGLWSATLSLVITPWLSRRFDKRTGALLVGGVLLVLLPTPLALSVVGLLPTLESGWLLPFLYGFTMLSTTFLIAVPTLLASMLADVVEENEVRTGRRDEGVIFALNVFAQKCASGLAVFVSTIILSIAGFPSHAVVGAVPADVIRRLSLTYISTLALLYVASLVCIRFYRITRETHAQNLRTLAERRRILAAAATR